GRVLCVTSTINKMLKKAPDIQRTFNTQNGGNTIDIRVYSLDDVEIKVIPSARFKTLYDFTDGCVADPSAKQINMMLMHPSCQVTRKKYAYMKLFTPGTDSRTADKYVWQTREYGDTFLLELKAPGIAFNVEA
ncbi:MAG: capsid protein, partial [Coprobacillaceae bacterium]